MFQHPTTNTSTQMMKETKIIRTVHLECLKNHAVHLGHHVLDGCAQFCPQNFLPDRCAACGCHRGFHRPYPIFDVLHHDDENHSATPAIPNGGGSDGTATTTTTTTDQEAACMGSERFPSPPLRVAEGRSKLMGERAPRSELKRERFPSPPPGFQEVERAGGSGLTSTTLKGIRKMKSKFTVKQKAAMRWLAGRLKWCLRNEHEKGEIKKVCDKIGVTRTMFRNWVYNNKRPTRKLSNVIVLSP